jgi:uncharacterized protein YqjF (DUF2071 family)
VFSLKNHPFAVETFFESSLVLTYAVKKQELQPLIPACLELDTFKNEWAFVAIAIVKTRDLRPKGFPAFMGNDFILAGFRVFVRYTNLEGRRLRGLYILKSETNNSKISFFGNIFTHYSYRTTDIEMTKGINTLHIYSKNSFIEIEVSQGHSIIQLPIGSPFTDWREARRFTGPLPFTFTFKVESKEVLTIEGVRQHWEPIAVEVIKHQVGFVQSLGLRSVTLANAFLVENIPYYWKKGKVEKWKG